MPDVVLPVIKVDEAANLPRSAGGTPVVDSPSTITDGGLSQRPRSATSSEGASHTNVKIIRNSSATDLSSAKPTSPPARPSTAIDPLSHHILKRTNTENTIPQKLRTTGVPDSPVAEIGSPGSTDIRLSGRQLTPEVSRSDSNLAKEKKKGVSFLSRFNISSKKKEQSVDLDDDESELGDHRTEGMNAHVFSSSIGANGYIPQHKEPPRYIKVRAHHKKTREFNRMFLAQELSGTKHELGEGNSSGLTAEGSSPTKLKVPKSGGAIWTTEFSKDGKYLAASGRDQVVRIWAVISTPEERKSHETEEDASLSSSRLSAPVFRSRPVREFEGHTGEVLDLSWSKNNFLLSSSMDKTVRLWHISRQECLCTFKHKDFVTSIAFHPTDDRFFLAGSLDSVLRLWSIPDKSVAFWNQLPDLITAVAFTPDGKTAIAGGLNGVCLFFDTEGLKYSTQIHVRSSRGKNAKGSKITGIRAVSFPPNDPEGEIKILITSNDSRVRMYTYRDQSLEMKFKGHENSCSQINASFSEDARYVICGSEDRKAYIWSTGPADAENKDKRPLELFEAHSDIVTATVIAPAKSRQLLSASGDPIYDLCNPPPVTLLSREESNASVMQSKAYGSEKRHSDPIIESQIKKTEESPAYLARCTHLDGNIIITADYLGCIKVFRQDCAYQKRRHDNWETGSAFSKKVLGRSSTIMSRHSGNSQSRRNSVSQSSFNTPPMPSEQILSWRNSVNSNVSSDIGFRNGSKASRSDRSISPGKFSVAAYQDHSNTNSQNNLASTARQQPYSGTPRLGTTTPSVSTVSPPHSIHKAASPKASQLPTPSFSLQSVSDDTGLRLDASGKSRQFWNLASWKSPLSSGTDVTKNAEGLKPPLQREITSVSMLSSDESSIDGEGGSEGEALVCRKCGGKDFRARVVAGKGRNLVCTRCGRPAD